MSETESWYYAKDNQQYGPVGVEVVRRMLGSGELQETDLVWSAGMPDWKEARAVEGLMPPVQTQQAGTMPPPIQPGPAIPPPPSWGGMHAPPPGPAPMGYHHPGAGTSQHGKAVASLVCGILSVICSPAGIGFVLAIVAVALSSNATSTMARTGNFEGRGMAKAGFILGIIGLIASAAACGCFGIRTTPVRF